MDAIFSFDDIIGVEDYVIKNILNKTNTDELTKALIREDKNIRMLFYKNMSLDNLKELDRKLKTTENFTRYDKLEAQRKILRIIAEMPYFKKRYRFENGFSDVKEFENYLLERHQAEEPYSIFDRDITMCKFFDSKNGDKVLEDIRQKNEAENMGNFKIPNTNIQLINYSICPKCGHIFSFKDISDYYLNPRPDPIFINKQEQYREDTRVFCNECETYFLPALIIADGTPKKEMQFLCRIQTMNEIERFYKKKSINVLSKNDKNIIKSNETELIKTFEIEEPTFFDRILGKEGTLKRVEKNVAKIAGIKNDVLIKELTEKPTLITNLIQYTPSNIVLNLIEGSNARKGDLLFGSLQ